MNYWLMKSEPCTFGIDDLKNMPDKTDHWDGVRNYQARNMMRDQMKKGDLVFFYHSNCKEIGIVGMMTITREGYPDHTACDPNTHYYDPKSNSENPIWYMVDVKFKKKFSRTLTLDELKLQEPLKNLALLRKGNRLSVMPVGESEWEFILAMTS